MKDLQAAAPSGREWMPMDVPANKNPLQKRICNGFSVLESQDGTVCYILSGASKPSRSMEVSSIWRAISMRAT